MTPYLQHFVFREAGHEVSVTCEVEPWLDETGRRRYSVELIEVLCDGDQVEEDCVLWDSAIDEAEERYHR